MQYEPAARVAAGYGVSLRTARKWKSRHDHGGQEALADRSSRPRRCRNKLSEEDFCRIFELRKARKTGDEIALYLGLCRSSVFRALRKLSCSRLSSLEKRSLFSAINGKILGKCCILILKSWVRLTVLGIAKSAWAMPAADGQDGNTCTFVLMMPQGPRTPPFFQMKLRNPQ